LSEIYKEIDKLEKSKMEVHEFSKKEEQYLKFAIAGALLLILGLGLKTTIFRNIP
jgi:Ca-activated chloride channel family protein